MMASISQAYSPHPPGLQQHPGVVPGHQMAPGHPQQAGGQPGPGMPQQMHMGVSGPGGPQVTQAGAMLGAMPPGVGGPGGPSAHALQHLNPNQAQIYQHQQQAQMAFNNPQMHMAQQHLMHQHQHQQQQRQAAARQAAMMQQQYNGGVPMNIPNGMATPINSAQFNAMRAPPNMRPVALPQHLQQQQQAAQMAEQQQAAQQAQQQHQHQLLAQQMVLQQANTVQANTNQGQPNQMGPQQITNLQNAQIAQHQAAQQQQQAAATAVQQTQGQGGQSQSQAQQPQPQPQQQPQQSTPQQQSIPATAMIHPRPRDQIKGHCILRLVQFGDHLSQFVVSSKSIKTYMSGGAQLLDAQGTKQRDDLNYWSEFVEQFFSPRGVLRHSVWIVDEHASKQYEITFPALARYFYTHFESGIKNMQMITEKAKEKELPHNCHHIESQKSSFIYWFENGSQLVANGMLRAQFDANQKIELLEFNTTSHEEYISRARVVEAARPLHDWQKEWIKINSQLDGKQSPEMNKKGKARPMKSPPTAPPDIDIPGSKVKLNMGITPSVFRFLELAEVMGQMNPLFQYSHLNLNFTPYSALDQYVANIATISAPGMSGPNMLQSGQRTPNLGQFPTNQSPSAPNLGLPDSSATIGGSPAQGHTQAPGMAQQQSQQGTSSSGPSANTSPNVTNKRRRPSVKTEVEETATVVGQTNGVPPKVKPSPRMGKRQKVNPPP